MLLMTCEMMYSMVEALSPFGENEFFVERNQFAMATKGDTTKKQKVVKNYSSIVRKKTICE